MADDEREQGDDESAGPEGGGAADGDGEAGPGPGPIERVREVWRNPAYRFVLLFLPYLAVVSIGYPLFVRHYNPVVQWFILLTARVEYWLFRIFTADVRVDEKLVFLGSFAVKIIDECTGIYEMLIFAAAVLAFPTTLVKKGLGLVLGCPLIYVFNVLRIAVLILVGRFWPRGFDFMHLYFWQATMIVMITAVWLIWITLVVRHEKVRDPAPA
jgi:archaeosortase B (VPXXXP-CTERM-specific)